jgi:hypothetical protein
LFRLRPLAEAAAYREKLRRDATGWETPGHLVRAALLPIAGATGHEASIPDAVAATPAETARDLREAKRDQASTRKAWDILASGGSDAYARALAALREDTRSYWLECLKEAPSDGLKYESTAAALAAWFDRHWREWYEEPIAELEHRHAIREHAVGSAYATNHLDMLARYEVHLDRKLERMLSMLVRLRELRPGVAPG